MACSARMPRGRTSDPCAGGRWSKWRPRRSEAIKSAWNRLAFGWRAGKLSPLARLLAPSAMRAAECAGAGGGFHMPQINPERVLSDLRTLAKFGAYKTGVHRPTLSDQDVAAREWFAERLRDAGLDAEIDGVANILG